MEIRFAVFNFMYLEALDYAIGQIQAAGLKQSVRRLETMRPWGMSNKDASRLRTYSDSSWESVKPGIHNVLNAIKSNVNCL